MKLREYLKTRANGKFVNALSRAEAQACGIPWPLRRGWPKEFADVEVDETVMRMASGERKRVRAARNQEHIERASKKESRAERKKRKKEARTKKANTTKNARVSSDAFLQSYEWRVVRMKVLKRDGARCACCGATRDHGFMMNVDHIRPRKTHPHLALDMDNLQVLCEVCNHGKGNWDSTDWRQNQAANDALDED